MAAWVESVTEDDDDLNPSKSLVSRPGTTRSPQRNFMPAPNPNAVFGRHYDYKRERTPVTHTTPFREQASRWQAYVKASEYPRPPSEEGFRADEKWLEENWPDLETPWNAGAADEERDTSFWLFSPTKRANTVARLQVPPLPQVNSAMLT